MFTLFMCKKYGINTKIDMVFKGIYSTIDTLRLAISSDPELCANMRDLYFNFSQIDFVETISVESFSPVIIKDGGY